MAVEKKRTIKQNKRTHTIILHGTPPPPTHPSFPYAPWPTTGAVPKELRGDLHSLSDHPKKPIPFIPRCLVTGGEKGVRIVTDKMEENNAEVQRALPHK